MANSPVRQLVALGGGGFSMEPDNTLLDDYVLSLTGKARPRVCFLPTASADSVDYTLRFYQAFAPCAEPSSLSLFRLDRDHAAVRAFLLAQDVIYAGGGNTVNLLALWRAHGLDKILREAWHAGVILTGISAGSICWFEAGVTDSYGPGLAPLTNGLGFLGGANCPHYDGEADRRPTFQRLVGDGTIPAGLAADDGCALHYLGDALHAVVSSREGARAYRVERLPGGGARETSVPARFLG